MSESNPDTENFDWVKARAECSLDNVFQVICLGIESDVRRRNEQLPQNFMPFVTSYDDGGLVVFRRTSSTHRIYRFFRTKTGIRVFNDKEPVLEATLILGDDGRCRLRVGDVECEFWQFRRRALEPLLFDPDV